MAAVAFPTIIGIALALALSGSDPESRDPAATPEPTPVATAAALKVDRFDSERAWRLLVAQVEMGPRPTGSERLARLAAFIKRRIPRGAYEQWPGGIRNVVGRIPGRRPAILVAAHYDTKDIPGFVGANDGAGGTAEVMEVARALNRLKRQRKIRREVRFAFFDGEECDDDSQPFYTCGLRGSRPHAARYAQRYRHVIVVDFVAEKDIRIPYEPGSDRKLWDRLRAAAARVGAEAAFPDETQGPITDDHTPFARAGVSAIDLIDFDFPCWHKTCDDLDVVEERSLDLTGETVVELVRTLARR